MKIICISLGTRGDMEPFLAIAEMLKARGHEVICVFPAQFQTLAEDSGLDFVPLSKRFIELIEGTDGKLVMGGKGSVFRKLGAYIRLYRKGVEINKIIVKQQHHLIEREQPDRIVYNGKSTYPVIWGIRNPGKAILVSPVPCLIHPVKERPHLGFNGNYGTFLNKLTYSLANYGFVKNILSTTKAFRKSPKVTGRDIKEIMKRGKLVYTISPALFPRPDYWPSNVQVLGYHERNKTLNWKPSDALLGFFDQHEKILMITFGSMTNPEPDIKTQIILDILQKHKIPALINTAAGGLIQPDRYDSDLFHFVSRIPYDWVLPKIYGVVHHGGSGTTHMSLKYGCVSMIVPHIIDQFLWNNMIHDLGVGPKGLPVKKLTAKKLEPKILDLWENQRYKVKAQKVAQQMEEENFEEDLCRMIIL